jgi:hypothetical protein
MVKRMAGRHNCGKLIGENGILSVWKHAANLTMIEGIRRSSG